MCPDEFPDSTKTKWVYLVMSSISLVKSVRSQRKHQVHFVLLVAEDDILSFVLRELHFVSF